MNYEKLLLTFMPGSAWSMTKNDPDTLVFHDGSVKPTHDQWRSWQKQYELMQSKQKQIDETKAAIQAEIGDIHEFLHKLCRHLKITTRDVHNG